MVWITAAYTTYASAPRSLAATCQAVIVTLYLALGELQTMLDGRYPPILSFLIRNPLSIL